MGFNRIAKKLMPDLADIDGAIIMVNASDPQLATVALFLAAVEDISHFVVLNKTDMVTREAMPDIKAAFKDELITAALTEADGWRGMQEIEYRLSQWRKGSKVAILGVFNSGKSTLIGRLTGADLNIDDIPGTTLEFTQYDYNGMTLIDTVGQVVDVNMPLMVSVDFDDCLTIEDQVRHVMRVDSSGIVESMTTATPGLIDAVIELMAMVEAGKKLVICGAGASALVAMEMAGQAQETGLPVICFTNNFASMQPVSFAKGIGEDEGSLADMIALVAEPGDTVIGVSASGGTGFVFEAMRQAQDKGATTIAITENRDTPMGKVSDIIIKSEAKPEGPSSSRVQAAHLAIGHALILTVAYQRGITAEISIQYMIAKKVRNKKMGVK